jgi:hypothetical protein
MEPMSLLEACAEARDEKSNASRYHFRESEGASRLVIEGGADRTPVSIMHDGPRFRVFYDGTHYHESTATGLFDYYKLSRFVAQGLMSRWQGAPREKRCLPSEAGVGGLHQRLLEERHATYPVPNAVREWAETQTAKAIGGRLHAWYKDRLASLQTPPVVRDVQRRAFAATFTTPIPLLFEDFYNRADSLLLDDLSKYRACAIALLNASARTEMFSRIRAHHGVQELIASREYAKLAVLAARFGVEVVLERGRPQALVRADDKRVLEWVVRVMRGSGWRGLFSPDGETYRSLDRTLMNLPGGLSPAILPYLAMVRLGRPLLTRLELAFVCLYGQGLYSRYEGGRNPLPPMPGDALNVEAATANEAIFLNARADRIKRAVRLVSEHTRNPLSPRRTTDLAFAVRFLMDYPEEHRGNIVGLAEKSIAWHRSAARREAEKVVASLGGKHEAARPPIDPPDDERITFLSTVEEIVEEGQRMNNCIASYALRAVRGNSLLFHAEKDGEAATIEVSPQGYVVQAAGAHNRRNKAARWARRALGRWAKEFPKKESPEAGADDLPF